MTDKFAAVEAAIRAGDKAYARDLLREIIKQNPSADAWYWAARVATNKEQAIAFCEKAIDLDPFHEDAVAALDRMKPRQEIQSFHQIPQQVAQSTVFRDAVSAFAQHDWDVKVQMSDMAQLEKSRGVSNIAALIVILLFSLLGMLIVLAGIATAKKEKVTLQVQLNGKLRVISKNKDFIVTSARELVPLAKSVKAGATYGGAILLGLVSFAVWFFLFS